jgi:hypothetical protein
MSGFDPLEETQENLHPVIVAHRAHDSRAAVRSPLPAGGTARLRYAALVALPFAAALLLWLM